MKKRNIGLILFGLAGVNLVTLTISLLIFPKLYERLGMPLTTTRIGIATMLITSIILISVLIFAGIIVLIKFWKK